MPIDVEQVPYNITGWLEKNKDPLNDTVVDQFKKGNNKLVQEIFADHPGQSGGAADAGGKGTPTVSLVQHSCCTSLIRVESFCDETFCEKNASPVVTLSSRIHHI